MSSLILTTVTRLVFFVVLLFSLYLLLRGHNSPGGGFIAGVMTALGILLQAIASEVGASMPAAANDASLPSSPRSTSNTLPTCLRASARDTARPITPPPTTTTSARSSKLKHALANF